MSSATLPAQVVLNPRPQVASNKTPATAAVTGATATVHVGAAATAAAAATAVAAAAAVSAVAALVAKAAAEGAVRAADLVIRLDERLAAQEQQFLDRRAEADRWRAVIADVVERNARITALTARVRRLGGVADDDPPIPPPATIVGCALGELDVWCGAVDRALEVAEAAVARRASAAFHRELAASLPAPRTAVDPGSLAAKALAAQDRAAREAAADRQHRHSPVTGGTVPTGAPALDPERELRARIEARTAGLAPDADPTDVVEVLHLAKAAVDAARRADSGQRPEPGRALSAAGPYLDRLGVAVGQANRRARVRRESAVTAARYLQALEQPVGVELPDGPVRAAAAKLREVLAGDREFDDSLAAEAERQRARVEVAATRRASLDAVRDLLTNELGYTVEGGVETLASEFDRLRLTRPDWEPDHHADLVVENGRIRGGLVRDSLGDDDEAVRRDTERCETLLADLTRLNRLIAGTDSAPGDPARTLWEVSRQVQYQTQQAGTADERVSEEPAKYRERPQ